MWYLKADLWRSEVSAGNSVRDKETGPWVLHLKGNQAGACGGLCDDPAPREGAF